MAKRKRPKLRRSPSRTKTPSAATAPLSQKIPAAHATDYNRQKPAWRIAKLEMSEPYGWHQMGRETVKTVLEKLRHYERMTWGEILKNKKYNHSVFVKDLCKPARDRLEEIGLHDLELLFRFRLKGTWRVWGIRQRNMFVVLWWDPEHEICPSGKR